MSDRRCFRAAGLVFVAAIVAIGCSPSSNSSPSPQPKAGPNAPQSVWDPNPSRAAELTQAVTIDKYHLSLPKDFTAEKLDAVPKGMKLFAWTGPVHGERPSIAFIAAIMSGKAEVAEAKKNMRQALVNFSGGMTDSSGIKIAKRGVTETGSLGGMPFSRFKWTGTGADQAPMNGMAYGGISDEQAILLLPMTSAANPESDMKLMEAVVATLKKP
jgi:hypothetical protein